MSLQEKVQNEPRQFLARAFTFVEDVVYIGLGVLLAAFVLCLLWTAFVGLARSIPTGMQNEQVIRVLDRSLLILLLVELLYTVQISFREHALLPEPFLLVGLISAIRRVLVVTAEFGQAGGEAKESPQTIAIELAVLSLLILVLVGSLIALRKTGSEIVAKRG